VCSSDLENSAFWRIAEIKSALAQLDACDLLNVFFEGCLERERGTLAYHSVYNNQ